MPEVKESEKISVNIWLESSVFCCLDSHLSSVVAIILMMFPQPKTVAVKLLGPVVDRFTAEEERMSGTLAAGLGGMALKINTVFLGPYYYYIQYFSSKQGKSNQILQCLPNILILVLQQNCKDEYWCINMMRFWINNVDLLIEDG